MERNSKLRLWPPTEVVRMADEEKWTFTAVGVYQLGMNLVRLQWALATTGEARQLAVFLEPLRFYSVVQSFESIGDGAAWWHNVLSNQPAGGISPENSNALRDVVTRWCAIVAERLRDLYLITPATALDAKHLLQGIRSLVTTEDLSILIAIEMSDLNEACKCILVGSPTAAEYMSLRAAESLLRRWYERKTNKKIKHQTWGNVLDLLLKEYPEHERPKEIALLGYLKLRRDEVAHPERVSSPREAETTLLTVCGLVTAVREIWSMLPFLPEPEKQLPMLGPEG